MGQVLHGSATTTAAVRRAIQHSHVWTVPAYQGISFGDAVVGGAVMSPASVAAVFRWALMVSADLFNPDQENELEAPTILQVFKADSRFLPITS